MLVLWDLQSKHFLWSNSPAIGDSRTYKHTSMFCLRTAGGLENEVFFKIKWSNFTRAGDILAKLKELMKLRNKYVATSLGL